jgi:hypothetical protein
MFDNNYDKNEGVSIWGHILDGAATGGIAGGVMGAGVGAIPGAILGGLVGLGTGLWDDHQDKTAMDAFLAEKQDSKTVDQAIRNAGDIQKERLATDPKAKAMSQDDAIKAGAERTFHQQQAAKQQKEGGGSFWDAIF